METETFVKDLIIANRKKKKGNLIMENSLSDTIWAIDQGKVKDCLRLAAKS